MEALFYAGALITLFSTMILSLGYLVGMPALHNRVRMTYFSITNLLCVLMVAWLGNTTGYINQTPYVQIVAICAIVSLVTVMVMIFTVPTSDTSTTNTSTITASVDSAKPALSHALGSHASEHHTTTEQPLKRKATIAPALLKNTPEDQGGIMPATTAQKVVVEEVLTN